MIRVPSTAIEDAPRTGTVVAPIDAEVVVEPSVRRLQPDLVALGAFMLAGVVHVAGLLGDLTYPMITFASVVTTVFGIRRHRPRVIWPWLSLLVVGMLWTIAGILRDVTGATGDLTSSRSLLPDLFALPGYVLFGLAVFGFVRLRDATRDLDVLLDAVLLTAGAGLIGHELLIGPTLGLADSALAARWAVIVYPALSTCMLVLVGRMAFTNDRKHRGTSFIVVGTSFLVIGDVVYAFGEIGMWNAPQHLLELPYLTVAALFGCLALNPDIHDVPHHDGFATHADVAGALGIERLAALLFALFAPLVVVATPNRGGSLWVQTALCVVLAVAAVTRLVRAITGQGMLRAELYQRATHDDLTGLPSRALVLEELAQWSRRGTDPVCVLFLDLDDFKLVNDSMGHAVGDDLLILVAERLRSAVRDTDLVGRISGDEFTVVTAHGGVESATALGDRIRRGLRQPFALAAGDVFVSASIGIAVLDPAEPAELRAEADRAGVDAHHRRASQVMQEADTAMYRSKERGKNVTTVFDGSMQESVQRRLELERELRSALDKGQISVVYQPIVRPSDGHVEGFEALMRWAVDGRNVSPADFIPVAESCGLIVPLGTFVLNEACRQVAWWRSSVPGAEDITVSVNLSPRQVLASDIVDATKRALDEFGLPGHALWLEITESTLMEDTVTTGAIMQGLRALGVRLSVDDFGTGFSSLSYLKRFPVSRVKIDRSFVMCLGESESDSSLIAAIVAMAGALGLDTVAEGVETAEQAQLLDTLGCHRHQGYLYAPGVPPDDVVEVMMELDRVINRLAAASRRCRPGGRNGTPTIG